MPPERPIVDDKKNVTIRFDDGYVIIFRWSFRHPKTGKVIRPKNGRPFPIRVKRNRAG